MIWLSWIWQVGDETRG